MRTLDRPRYRLTTHAHQRAIEMGVTHDRVLEAVNDPRTDYPGRPGSRGDQRRIATKHDLAVVYSPTTSLVVTILWNEKEHR